MAPVLRSVIPAVVSVTAVADVQGQDHLLLNDPDLRRFLRRNNIRVPDQSSTLRQQRMGSGFIWEASAGLVVTNAHLVAGADWIRVGTADGQTHEARVLGLIEQADVALLRIAPQQTPSLRRGRTDRLQVGDFVMVIGNPFGLGQSVSSGIVSALNRTHPDAQGLGALIQTDAPINPGNSGGPLIDTQGAVIGMTTALVSPGNGNVGIGFAIPIEQVERILETILNATTPNPNPKQRS